MIRDGFLISEQKYLAFVIIHNQCTPEKLYWSSLNNGTEIYGSATCGIKLVFPPKCKSNFDNSFPLSIKSMLIDLNIHEVFEIMLSCRVFWFVYRPLYTVRYLSGYEVTAFYLIKNIIIRALHKPWFYIRLKMGKKRRYNIYFTLHSIKYSVENTTFKFILIIEIFSNTLETVRS